MKYNLLTFIGFLLPVLSYGQATTLQADGPGNTYELITSVLAPGYNPVETPDCAHAAFGRHIEEIWDADLMAYVFNFHIHTADDNDRCIKFDRQRNEIKTYASSPAHLKGVAGETVEYKWKFKLDAAFQASSSFTHIHQIKAVGGTQASMPLITLAPRKSSPDKLQLLFSDSITQGEIASIPLADVKGIWIEATELITYNEAGSYEITLNRVSDGVQVFHYQNSNIRMWRTDADHLRPKWGIYRSLNNAAQLRDEEVRFADFSIEEITLLSVELSRFDGERVGEYHHLEWDTQTENNNDYFEIEYSKDAQNFRFLTKIKGHGTTLTPNHYDFKYIPKEKGIVYYRLKQVDFDGEIYYSNVIAIKEKESKRMHLSPNPTKDKVNIIGGEDIKSVELMDRTGKILLRQNSTEIDLSNFEAGLYFVKVYGEKENQIFKVVRL